MKVFISCDMEGIAGVVDWREVDINDALYARAQDQMTKEVSAACMAAQTIGATEILVKDAHASGLNLKIDSLPHDINIHRSWAKHPYSMMFGLDHHFDAVILTGYHDASYGNGNPLAHTMSESKYQWITLNDCIMSEMMMNAYIAAYEKVPVIAVTGDQSICDAALRLMPNVKTVAVKKGEGGGCITMHPDRAIEDIRHTVKEAFRELKAAPEKFVLTLPEVFVMEINFKNHIDAYKAMHYPGVTKVDEHTVKYETNDYLDLLKMFFFAG